MNPLIARDSAVGNPDCDNDRQRRAFEKRTVGLIVDQFRRHVLPEAILLALLAGVGLPVDQVDR